MNPWTWISCALNHNWKIFCLNFWQPSCVPKSGSHFHKGTQIKIQTTKSSNPPHIHLTNEMFVEGYIRFVCVWFLFKCSSYVLGPFLQERDPLQKGNCKVESFAPKRLETKSEVMSTIPWSSSSPMQKKNLWLPGGCQYISGSDRLLVPNIKGTGRRWILTIDFSDVLVIHHPTTWHVFD